MQIISHEKRSSKLMACEKLCSSERGGDGGKGGRGRGGKGELIG
jgi:hypothetical protein